MTNVNSYVISSPYSLYPNVILFLCFIDKENILTFQKKYTILIYSISQNVMLQKFEKEKMRLPL